MLAFCQTIYAHRTDYLCFWETEETKIAQTRGVIIILFPLHNWRLITQLNKIAQIQWWDKVWGASRLEQKNTFT